MEIFGNYNYVDIFVIFFLLYVGFKSIKYGIWIALVECFSFVTSILIAIRFYPYFSKLLVENFSLYSLLANAISFIALAIISESLLGAVGAGFVTYLPQSWIRARKIDILSIIPAFIKGLVLLVILFIMIVTLPFDGGIKNDISNSLFGKWLVNKIQYLEDRSGVHLQDTVKNTISYFTIDPKTDKTVFLTADPVKLTSDETSEKEFFILINQERQKEGLPALLWDEKLRDVARVHANDMWKRKYFGHYSPEGEDVGDRLENYGITDYLLAGENLALAPTVYAAHLGLMNSEGHRANVLDVNYQQLGVGVIQNANYGKMVVQVFLR